MQPVCPLITPILTVTDNARLAAEISCALVRPGSYLPIVGAPRLWRPDAKWEINAKAQAIPRTRARMVLLADLADDQEQAIRAQFAASFGKRVHRIAGSAQLKPFHDVAAYRGPPLVWGRDRLGIGTLKAMRARVSIVFEDRLSPAESLVSKSSHLVVCEEGDELAQVMAANYAWSLRAGLHLIPEVSRHDRDALLERFYGLDDDHQRPKDDILAELKAELLAWCGQLPVPDGGSITFVTGGVPYGFAVTGYPTTHLFSYPDLGGAIINGFSAEQADTAGVGIAAVVDPHKTDATEIAVVAERMVPRGTQVRKFFGKNATARNVAEMMEWFPYDLLVIATHCGDDTGQRWTYEFHDAGGTERRLVVDIALGFRRTDDADLFRVDQYMRFVSLDGVDWDDPAKEEKLVVGSAINDFMAMTRDKLNGLQPISKEPVARVRGSSTLAMYDFNLLQTPRTLAQDGVPIVINNACGSWHRLALDFAYANARAYLGTLFPLMSIEAHEVVVRLFDGYFGKPLPAALWGAQNEVYRGRLRRPYVMMGVYPQKLRIRQHDAMERLKALLERGLKDWKRFEAETDPGDTARQRHVREAVAFYDLEVRAARSLATELRR